MKEKINIAEILKDKPLLLKFYSTTFGPITFNGVHNGKVYFFSEDTNAHSVKQNGKMYDGGECIIFPSKEMHDWEKFSWKKGDVLVMDGFRVVFDKWVGDDYTRFNAVHLITSSGVYFNKPSQNRYSPISHFITKYWRKMTDTETKIYMNSLEIECGGKLNLATLEIEKQQLFDALAKKGKAWDSEKKQVVDLKPNVELKPFDRVLVRNCKSENWRANLFGYIDKDGFYCCVWANWAYCIPYIGNESLLGTTKDVEG